MLRLDADDLAQTAERILQVDKLRLSSDLFKLPDWLRSLVETRLTAYRLATRDLRTATGSRVDQSEQVKSSIIRLTQRMRDGHKFLSGLPDFRVPENQKLSALQSYGFAGGKVGDLQKKERVIELARLALDVSPSVKPVAARYPDDLLDEIRKELDILEGAEPGSGIGVRSAVTKVRREAIKDLSRAVSRVRRYYGACSDDIDATPELSKIGITPVQRSGQRRVAGEGDASQESPAS